MEKGAPKDWLDLYYQRITDELRGALQRKDLFTNWGLTILVALIAAYSGFGLTKLEPLWRLALVLPSFCLLIRFFVHSCLAYAYVSKWNFLIAEIEKNWMHDSPTRDQLVDLIERYDHDRRIPATRTKLVLTQLKAGFALILAVPLIMAFHGMYDMFVKGKCQARTAGLVVIFATIAYVIYEVVLFLTYSPIRKPSSSDASIS